MTRTPSAPALTSEQVRRYQELRGYSEGSAGHDHPPSDHAPHKHGGHTGHHSPNGSGGDPVRHPGSGGPGHAAGIDRDPNGRDLGCLGAP